MSLTTDQKTDRRAGLPASEFPAILGLDPFRSPLDVWLEHTGTPRAVVENDRMRWGHLVEPLVCQEWESRIGDPAERCSTFARDVKIAGVELRVMASPDRIAPTKRKGFECKTHSMHAADYGPEGTDQVPVRVAIQCQIGMYVTGYREWDVGAFWDGLPHWFGLRYDAATAESAVEFGARWWRDHVIAHVAPKPDGTKQTEAAIRGMFPGVNRPMKQARWLAPDVLPPGTIDMLRALRREYKTAERTFEACKQMIEATIADNDGIQWKDGAKDVRISWRRSTDTRETDYRGALYDFLNRVQLAATAIPINDGATHANALELVLGLLGEIERGPDLERYTKIVPGSRRFLTPRAWSADVGGAAEEPDGD